MSSAGLDNAFVILNSWHRSDKKASVEDRLGDTMSEAGVRRTLKYLLIFSPRIISRWASWSPVLQTSSASTRQCWRLTPTSRSSAFTPEQRLPSTLSIRWLEQFVKFIWFIYNCRETNLVLFPDVCIWFIISFHSAKSQKKTSVFFLTHFPVLRWLFSLRVWQSLGGQRNNARAGWHSAPCLRSPDTSPASVSR